MYAVTKRRLIGLIAWALFGLIVVPFGQAFLIAGADGHSQLAILFGLAVIGCWLVGVWLAFYKLFFGGLSGESRAGAAVKAVGGMVVVLYVVTIACGGVFPLLRPKPSTNVDFFWTHLDRTNSFAVATFIKQNPESPHVKQAKDILSRLESSDWNRILSETDPSRKASELDLYLRMDPEVYPWHHRQEAEALLDEADWEHALNAAAGDQRERARAYLILHKQGKHSKEAAEIAR